MSETLKMSASTTTAELVPELTTEEEEMYFELLDLNEEGLTEEEVHKRKTKIFVGGLKFSSDSDVLEDYFGKFGDIKEAVVIRERKSGLSKGYGFVTMMEFKSAVAAIQDKAPKLDGRRCNVCLAYIGQKKNALSPSKKNGYHVIGSPLISPHFVNAPPSMWCLPIIKEEKSSDLKFKQGCLYGMAIPSPTIIGPGGQIMQYQFGLPPLHQTEPVYHIAPSPTIHEHRESTLLQSPLTPVYHQSPLPSPMMFHQQLIVPSQPSTHAPTLYNNAVNQQHLSAGTPPSTQQIYATTNNNNNTIPNNNNNNNTIPSTAAISPYTQITLCETTPTEIGSQSGPVMPASGQMITTNNNNNHVIPNGHMLTNGSHLISNNTNNHTLVNGTGPIMNGHLVGNGQIVTSTTYVHSPAPSPAVPSPVVGSAKQIFQFHAHPAGHMIMPSREILQQ